MNSKSLTTARSLAVAVAAAIAVGTGGSGLAQDRNVEHRLVRLQGGP